MAPPGRPGPESAHDNKPNSSEPKLFGFCSFGLLSALVVAPLPLGSARPWAISLLAIWLWLWLLVLVFGGLLKPATATWLPRLKAAALPLGLLAAYALLVAAQLAPWPHAWRVALLPLSIAPGDTGPGALSLDAYATKRYLITTLTYLAAFVLVVALCSTQKRVTWLLGTIVASGVLQALIAVVLNWSGAEYQYFFYEFQQGGRANGTFPNPDHLAGYMELCLAAGLGLMMAQFTGAAGGPRRDWRARTLEAMQFVMSPKMLLRMMLVVMVIALVMTHSRMGNGAFFLAMLLAGAAVAVISPRLRRAALWLVLSMVIVDAVIIGQAVGLERVVERIQGTELGAAPGSEAASLEGSAATVPRQETIEQRLRTPIAALAMVKDAPWLGHGGGAFYAGFPMYKTPDVIPQFFSHAHNDYVEVAVDTGLPGLALWLAVGLATAWRALRLLRDNEPRLSRGVGVAAAVALFALGLHSVVDFNLQIPSNALTFTALLALVWATRPQPRQARNLRAEMPKSLA